MGRLRHLPLLLSLWGLITSGAEAASEDSGACYRSTLAEYEALFLEAFTDEPSIYINCMSFGQDKALETAIVSGNGSTVEQVLRFECKGETLFVFESEREFSTERNESCLECASRESPTEDACLVRESVIHTRSEMRTIIYTYHLSSLACADACDRCYVSAYNCGKA